MLIWARSFEKYKSSTGSPEVETRKMCVPVCPVKGTCMKCSSTYRTLPLWGNLG